MVEFEDSLRMGILLGSILVIAISPGTIQYPLGCRFRPGGTVEATEACLGDFDNFHKLPTKKNFKNLTKFERIIDITELWLKSSFFNAIFLII